MVADCNAARFFGFISDESTDCSTKEQASICVRFYDKNAKAVREEFLGFTDAKRTTGEALTDIFLLELEQKGIQVEKCGHRDTTALPISQVFVEMYGQGVRNEFPSGLYSL